MSLRTKGVDSANEPPTPHLEIGEGVIILKGVWGRKILTYAVLDSIVFFGEFVTVVDNELSTPDVDHCSNRQICVSVELLVYSSYLSNAACSHLLCWLTIPFGYCKSTGIILTYNGSYMYTIRYQYGGIHCRRHLPECDSLEIEPFRWLSGLNRIQRTASASNQWLDWSLVGCEPINTGSVS